MALGLSRSCSHEIFFPVNERLLEFYNAKNVSHDIYDIISIVSEGDFDSLISLHTKGINLQATNTSGDTLLHIASANGHLQIVSFLHNKQVDLNQENQYQRSPLHEASINGHLEVVDYLCKNGANLDARDEYGRTAFFLACMNGIHPIAQYFCNMGINIDVHGCNGVSPLILSKRFHHYDIYNIICRQQSWTRRKAYLLFLSIVKQVTSRKASVKVFQLYDLSRTIARYL